MKTILLLTLTSLACASNMRTSPRFMSTGASADAPVIADSHHDFDTSYKTAEEQAAEMKQHDYEFVHDIHTTKQELVVLLIKMRDEMKKHFGHLEETVRKRINGIFKVACVSAETAAGSG